MDAVDYVLGGLIALLGSAGFWGWRKMTAESVKLNAEARKTEAERDVIDDGAAAQLRTAIKAADEEMSLMRGERYTMQDEIITLRRDLAETTRQLGDTTARLEVALGRIDRLEAKLASLGIDPATLNGGS